MNAEPHALTLLPAAAPASSLISRVANVLFRSTAERLLCLDRLNDVYLNAARRTARGDDDFASSAISELDISVDVDDLGLGRIPRTGPLVVVANHPFGAVEALALLSLLGRIRSDVRVMSNRVLNIIPELSACSFFVDPFGRIDSAARSVRGLAQSIRWVAGGGALLVFPAGEVSHLDLSARRVVDGTWSPTIARIVARSGATVLPMYVGGRNSALFQLAGLLHASLRTMLLPRELAAQRGARLRIEIGSPIPPQRIARLGDDRAIITFLRRRTYLLAQRRDDRPETASMPAAAQDVHAVAVAPAVEPDLIEREIEVCARASKLVERGEYIVVAATAGDIPHTLREIGRLRELAFRDAGEGTGQALDLDRFDEDYDHLVLWHRALRRVVGSYRIGRADEIVLCSGVRGLYSNTLFSYDERLVQRIGPALELGRSFVRVEHQREFQPLALLWSAIGAYIVRNPQYRALFGPVSISTEYNPISQRVMATFLERHAAHTEGMPLVRPRNPFAPPCECREVDALIADNLGSLDEADEYVRDLERDGRGLPVLLRHYLKLGGRLLGLNVDPAFSNVVDALIAVDLPTADRALLARYMGTEGAESYLRHHGS